MKIKYILGLFILALSFNACEPMEDIYAEIDADKVNYATTNIELTLTDENYTDDMDLSYPNFSSYDPAEDYIPAFLADAYPSLGSGSRAMVTYNYYSKVYADEDNAYELSDDEYTLMGQSHSNLSGSDEENEFLIENLLNSTQFATAAQDKTVKYNFYSKKENRYVKVNADFSTEVLKYYNDDDYYELDDDDYDFLGFGKYNNFAYISNAEDNLGTLATERGHTLPKVYKSFVYNNYYDEYVVFAFDGTAWSTKESTTPMTVEYLHNGTVWTVAPQLKLIESNKTHTKEYTLTNADYELVGLGTHHNFSVGDGYPQDPIEVKLELFNTIFKNNFPEMAVGDVYLVHYNIYNGSSDVWDITLEVIEE